MEENSVIYFMGESIPLLFGIWCVVLYFLSIRKCFWKEGKNKAETVVLTALINPLFIYAGSLLFVFLIRRLLNIGEGISAVQSAVVMSCAGFILLILVFLFSRLLGKWFDPPNKSLITFVVLMYSAAVLLGGIKQNILDAKESSIFWAYADLVIYLTLFIAVTLLYHFVIRALSELTTRQVSIRTKLFTVPPSLFMVFYIIISGGVIMWINSSGSVWLTNLFSTIILYLFIWAFYVIVGNINATNKAIEAERLAAEMAVAEARIEADLSIAQSIQTSALPSVFPPFPEQKEFELFASMHAAKEVGGDFYDYYMLGENTLGFLIADVSGKSIPGAMFMMTSKTVIKGLAESGLPVDVVFSEANEKLCEGNDAEMFLTAWMGYLDLKTGLIKVANAGHNPPVLIRDGKAEYVILKPGLMLAGMDGMTYREQEVQLQKGDILYLFTDGVTEAMDADEELYGEDRLIELLSFGENYPESAGENGIVETVCDMVSADIEKFVAGAEQSDDITMLCIRYLG